MNIQKTLFLCALLGAFALAFILLPPGTFSLDVIKTHQQALLTQVEHAPLRSALTYFVIYVVV
ncbi:TVP38/TMEM64 family protein, partial [Escherichia coli]|nr:TVP38/TMEM64 family protein [Escherichia coli]